MSKPLVCATVTADSTAELRRRRDAVRDADLVELRLDTVADPDVSAALEGRQRPVIVTCRPAWEGGAFEGPEHDRRALLEQALALGAEYVDIEWRAGFVDLVHSVHGRRIVLSMHDFEGVPKDLPAIADAMRATGAQVIKIAVKTAQLSDCLPLLDLGQTLARDDRPTDQRVLIGMGDAGLATRVLACKFQSAWTYAGTLREVGQLTVADLIDRYQFRSLGDATRIYGIVGRPVSHSVSPAMHNAAIRSTGIDAVYLPLAAADVDDFFAFAGAIGLVGASVTIPFKIAMFDRVDDVDPLARRVGAINTIRMTPDERFSELAGSDAAAGRSSGVRRAELRSAKAGTNTDVEGFLRPLAERSVEIRGKRASILGAGGSARAVANALAEEGALVRVHGRRAAQAEAVARAVDGDTGPWPPEAGSWDILINCTPIGMYPDTEKSPMDGHALDGSVVYDLVYNPTATRLLKDAAAAGCTTIGGLEMVVAQARQQFRWWTGIQPPAEVMRAAALERLGEFTDR